MITVYQKHILLVFSSLFILSFWACSLDRIDPLVKYDPCYEKVTSKFFPNTLSCDSPCLVKFTNESVGAKTYTWDFGDGEKDTSANPTHTFKKTGRFIVKLRATDENGCYKDTMEEVRVVTPNNLPDPIPNFTFTYLNGNQFAPTTVVFTNASQNAVSYKWYFGDGIGDGDTAVSPKHIYTSGDNFNVTLEAYNSNGVKRQVIKTVAIKAITFKTICGSTTDNTTASDMILTNDGGYALVGTISTAAGNSLGYIANFNKNGAITLGGEDKFSSVNRSQFKSITQTANGNFWVAGAGASPIQIDPTLDLMLVQYPSTVLSGMSIKTLQQGTPLAVTPRPQIEIANSIDKTADGGFVLCGTHSYTAQTPQQSSAGGIYVVKANATGTYLWENRLSGSNFTDEGFVVKQTADGSFAIWGTNIFLKTDTTASLNVRWSPNVNLASAMSPTKDGGYIFAGYANGLILFKLNKLGAFIPSEQKSFGSESSITTPTYVQECKDGGYIVCGGSKIFRVDAALNKLWDERDLIQHGLVTAKKVLETSDGGFVVLGDTQNKIILIKTDKYGLVQ